jgi:hypothetical protein
MEHFDDKRKRDTFPIRIPFLPVTYIYSYICFLLWDVKWRFRSLKVVVLGEGECTRPNESTGVCEEAFYEYYKACKLFAWHEKEDAREECKENDFFNCKNPKCVQHAEIKILNWHNLKNVDGLL